jgi:hypothetical protein
MRLYLTGDFEDFDYCVGVVEAEVAVVVDAASAGMIEGAVYGATIWGRMAAAIRTRGWRPVAAL